MGCPAGAQTGHSPGSGPVNFSMGGAATAMPLDVTGALWWNPVTITAFRKQKLPRVLPLLRQHLRLFGRQTCLMVRAILSC